MGPGAADAAFAQGCAAQLEPELRAVLSLLVRRALEGRGGRSGVGSEIEGWRGGSLRALP